VEQLNNVKALKSRRKSLRNNLTPAEATLWSCLQQSKLNGKKFRRQHSVGGYILDFYCPGEKLCIELDGGYHFTKHQKKYDKQRTDYLNAVGIKVIRFENHLVFDNTAGVLSEIKKHFSGT
jgi:very-short-patch-repair endonuclease